MGASEEFISLENSWVEEIRKSFISYAEKFRKEDPVYNQHMELKQYHTQMVCNEIIDIGQSLGMDRSELNFAEVIAWLHDIGRFEQYHQYGTFSDSESENHSEIGLRVIEQEKLLKHYNPELKEIIYRSILNHNVPRVPAGEPKIIDFYSRLIRDADKVDIWRVSLEMNVFYKIRNEALPDTYDISRSLLEKFRTNEIITVDQIGSFFDSILFRASWLYDINFPRTFTIIQSRNIIHRLLDKLPKSDTLTEIYHLTEKHLKLKVEANAIEAPRSKLRGIFDPQS